MREEGRRRAYHSFSAAPATVEPHSGFPPSAGADVKTHGDALEKNEQQGIGQAEFTSPPPPQAGVTSVVVMKWGLVPSWHKKEEKPDFFRAFNARSETVKKWNQAIDVCVRVFARSRSMDGTMLTCCALLA